MSFSYEEKCRILSYVKENSRDKVTIDDEMWKELAKEMNRDWQEIREAYPKIEEDEQVIAEAFAAVLKQGQELMERVLIPDESDVQLWIESSEHLEELQNVDLIDIDTQCSTNPEALKDICNEDKEFLMSGKRSLDVMGNYKQLSLELMQKETAEGLQMKREETQKKIEYYELLLQQKKEIHKEKMKLVKLEIAKAKDSIYHMDYVLRNKSLTKKFKSGPI